MEHRQIGELSVSVVGLGCNNFGMSIDPSQTQLVVDAALDAGINYFDTADFYGNFRSEEYLGNALGSRRDDVILATKFGHSASKPDGGRGGAPEWVRSSLEASLKRLGTDCVDHFQMHLPDEQTPLEDTLATLEDLQAEGKVREIGCSNFTGEQLASAGGKFKSVQNHYSILTRDPEADVLPVCESEGVAFVPYFPLESGLLTGKYTSTEAPEGTRLAMWGGEMRDMFLNEANLAAAQRLSDYAQSHGRTLLELAMSWLTSQPQVATVIAGATKPEQVAMNAAATGWVLPPEERQEVAALARLEGLEPPTF